MFLCDGIFIIWNEFVVKRVMTFQFWVHVRHELWTWSFVLLKNSPMFLFQRKRGHLSLKTVNTSVSSSHHLISKSFCNFWCSPPSQKSMILMANLTPNNSVSQLMSSIITKSFFTSMLYVYSILILWNNWRIFEMFGIPWHHYCWSFTICSYWVAEYRLFHWP